MHDPLDAPESVLGHGDQHPVLIGVGPSERQRDDRLPREGRECCVVCATSENRQPGTAGLLHDRGTEGGVRPGHDEHSGSGPACGVGSVQGDSTSPGAGYSADPEEMPVSHIRFVATLAPALLLGACLDEGDQPCDDYVAYMCECHGDTEDCTQLTATYEGADQDLQDECAIALDAQQADDETSGHVCTDGADTGA